MKKIFLSLIMLLSIINPIFGMEEDGDQQGAPGLGEAALSAMANHLHEGNTHLVRSIAREWHRQNPNGTYREFFDEYTQRRSLPVRLMRAVWQEVMRAQQITRQIKLLQQIAGYAGEIARIINQVTPFFGPNCQLVGPGIIFDVDSNAEQFEFNSFHKDSRGQGVAHCSGNCNIIESVRRAFSLGVCSPRRHDDFMSYYEKIWSAAVSFFGRQVLPETLPIFCTIRMSLIGQQLSSDLIQRLGVIVQEGCQRGFCVLIHLVSNGANMEFISHIIILHNGVIAVIPNIIFPAGASDAERQQITQDAIIRAMRTQPVLRMILEAIQYLESLDS